MNLKEKEASKNEIALFRYGLIAPVITDTFTEESQAEYFRNTGAKKYTLNGKEVKIAPATIKKWYLKYKKEYPHITGTLIYQKLSDEGYINPFEISLGTVLKFIRDNKLLFNETENVDRRAFEMEFANDCWQADTSQGPYLTIDKQKIPTYLIAIIDDASRMIVSAKFYYNDNAVNFQHVFKNAVKTYGIPKKLFVDNGRSYKNEQLNLICANLGLVLIHARPYSGQSKAKIERWFHTMKATWMRGLDWNEIKSIEELNLKLKDFINFYNHKEHSSLRNKSDEPISPNERWFQNADKIKKKDNQEIDAYFLHTVYPRIKQDAIAYVKGQQFEVDMKYIGKKITIKFNPEDLSKAWIYEDNHCLEEIKLVNKIENSKIKRKKAMY